MWLRILTKLADVRSVLSMMFTGIIVCTRPGFADSTTTRSARTTASSMSVSYTHLSAIPDGATKVASKLRKGTVDPTIVNITTMVDTNPVSTIALVFVCFINLHSTYKKID